MRITSAKLSDETRLSRCESLLTTRHVPMRKLGHVLQIMLECRGRIVAKRARSR